MIDDTKLATLSVSNDLPIDDGINESIAPKITFPENPFANISSIVPSSRPEYKNVGLSSDQALNIMLSGREKLLKDPFIQAQRTEVPEVAGYDTIKESENFNTIGVFPGLDVEETYGTAETNWEKLYKGTAGALVLATHQFADQLFSWSDTAGIFAGNSPFKESEFEAINQWQKDFDNKYHIFQTQEDRNTFFNMSNLATNLQTSGYGIGAILEMAAEEFALSALTTATFGGASEIQAARTIQLATRNIGKVLKNTRDLERSLQGTNTLRKIFNNSFVKFVNPIDNIMDFSTSIRTVAAADRRVFGTTTGALRTTARGFGAFYRDLRMVNAGITEAKATVAPVMEDAYNTAIEEYKNINGVEPSNDIKTKLKQRAFEAVQVEGAVQSAWIALTDRISFDGVFNKFKGLRFLDDGLIAKGILTNSEKAVKEGADLFVAKKGMPAFIHQLKISPFKTLIKAPIVYAKTNLMEGVQESGQDVIDSATKQWYMYNYGTAEQRKEQKSMNDFLYAGAKQQLTMDGLKTFMSGFLTGGIMNVLGSGLNAGKSLYERTANKDGYKSSVERADAERNKLVSLLNESTNNKTDFYRSLVELNSAMDQSAKNGRKKEYWDNKNDFINKYVLSIVKSGVDDVVIDRMRESINELTVDEFKQAYSGSVHEGLSEEKSKDVMRNLVSTFENKVKEVKETYEDIKNNYGNPYNPKKYDIGTPEYDEEVANFMAAEEAIDQMSFSKSTYLDIASRQQGLLKNIKSYFPNLSFNTLYSLTSPSITLKKELEILQKEYETVSDPALKEEKKQKIDLLNKYKENIEKTAKQIDEVAFNLNEKDDKKIILEKINNIKLQFSKDNAQAIGEILKLENKESSAPLTTDTINKAVNDIFDYLQLQTDFEDSLSYFNTIANPNAFEGLHQSHYKEIIKILNKAKESEEEDTKDKKQITIKVFDKEGKEHEVTLIEGNDYITESNPTKRITPKGGKVITTYEQDVISIESIDVDNNTITVIVNGGTDLNKTNESITYTIDEFTKNSGRLYNLNTMNPEASMYFRNRDRVIVIKVNKTNGLLHRIDGKNANKDYSSDQYSENVYAMLRYEIDPKDPQSGRQLFFEYKTKDGKVKKAPFSLEYYKKYGVKTDKQYLLRFAPTQEEYLKKATEQRKLNIYNRQVQIFELLIKEQEEKSGPREQRKIKIQEELDNIKTELDEAEELVELANQEIDSIVSGKKRISQKEKRKIASLKQEINKYQERLKSLKETSTLLNAEKIEIEKELQTLNEVSETYYKALSEITGTETPFLRAGESQTIYGQEEEQLELELSQRPVNYVPVDDFEKVINSLNFEKNDIENKIKVVEDTIKRVEKLISRFIKYDDIINTIVGVDPTSNKSKKDLQTALVKLKLKEQNKIEPDNEKIELINNLLSGLNTRFKGFENQVFGREIVETIGFVNLFDIAKKEKEKLDDQLNFVSKEIEQITQGQEYVEKNILPISEKIEYLKNIEKILLEGQAKLESLNLIERSKKTIKAPTTEAATEFADYNDVMSFTEVVPGDNSEDNIIVIDFDKVLFKNGLYKSAGRHYSGIADQKENVAVSPEQDRFFTFTSNTVIADQNYFLVPITKDNDKYSIVQKSYVDAKGNTVEVKDDIKLLVVKKVAGKFIPVDKYGNPLSEDAQVKDNLVFNSMVNTVELMQEDTDSAIKWLRSENNKTFTIDRNVLQPDRSYKKIPYTDKELADEINSFKKFRNEIIKNIKEGKEVSPLKVIKKSNGTQRKVPLDVTTGKPQELPLQGRLIEEDSDFSKFEELKHPDGTAIELKVSTLENGISSTIKPGRLVMHKGDTFYQVYNRRITEEEKNNIFDVILAILPMMGRRYLTEDRVNDLTKLYEAKIITLDRFTELTKELSEEEEEKNQFDLGIRYLMNTIYWSQVKEGGKVGNKQFYIKGDSLYVGEKAYKFEIDGALNLQNIIDSKDEIMNLVTKDKKGVDVVENMFHSINNTLINKKDKSFQTAKVVDGKIVEDEKFKNYLEYLLSNKNGRTPIVYTNIVEYNQDEPQLANSYLSYARPNEEVIIPPKPAEGTNAAAVTKIDFSNIPVDKEIVLNRNTKAGVINIIGIWNGTNFTINSIINKETGEDLTTEYNTENKSSIIKNEIEEFINDIKKGKENFDQYTEFYNTNQITKAKYDEEVNYYKALLNKVNGSYFNMKLSEPIVNKDTSDIKANIEALIRMGKIEYVDDTTNAEC